MSEQVTSPTYDASPAAIDGAPINSPVNPQKDRKGLNRVWHALGYSVAGLRAGWQETAFRQEAAHPSSCCPHRFGLAVVGLKQPCSLVP